MTFNDNDFGFREPKKLWEQGIVFYEVDPTFR